MPNKLTTNFPYLPAQPSAGDWQREIMRQTRQVAARAALGEDTGHAVDLLNEAVDNFITSLGIEAE
jgi:hypothetical protein